MNHMIGAVLILIATQAQAGNVIRFQNGTVDPETVAHNTQSLSAGREVFVLQFKQAITAADQQELKSQGIAVYRYVPDDALIVRASETQLSTLAQNGKVHGFMLYQGSMKLSPHLPTVSVMSSGHATPIVITSFTKADAQNVLNYLKANDSNLQVLDFSGSTLSVKMSDNLVPSLGHFSGVEFVQAIEKMEPLNILLDTADDPGPKPKGDYTDLTGFETGTKAMGFEAVWALGFRGEGQVAAMADTGLDSGDLSTISGDFKGAVLKGLPFGIGAKTWEDPMGHGTHVAGSVIGRGGASGGKILGGANKAKFVAEGLWSPLIDNLTLPPKLNVVFDAAYSEGARVHTNSWGSVRAFGAYDTMAQQVDQYMWDHPDFLVVFAAGNSGIDKDKDGLVDADSIGSPATAKNTLTVGASENQVSIGGIQKQISELKTAKDNWPAEPIWSSKLSDNIDGMAMFSSRGPTKDGRIKPDIVAPGTNILSSRSHEPTAEALWGEYNKDYVYSGGTSMATPLAAGAAVVTREVIMKNFKLSSPSAALIKAVMMHTAHDMFPGQYGRGKTQELEHRPNNNEGYGRVDMAQVAKLKDATELVEASVGQGEEVTRTVEVKNGKLLANLVYTDAPGTPSAAAALVNDLSLEVSGPVRAGTQFANAKVKVFASADTVNNHEIQELSGLKNGTYKITVKGVKVPMGKDGKQPFALVYTAQ